MKLFSKSIAFLAISALTFGVQAKKIDAGNVNNYLRSSIYTILLNSENQNQRFEKEAKEAMAGDAGSITSIAKSFAGTDAKKAANETEENLFSLPAKLFPEIEIPNQFNNHNLEERVIDFDAIRATVTDQEKDLYNPKTKNQKAGAFAKGLASGLMGGATGKSESSMLKVDEVDDYLPAVMHKYFEKNKVAPKLLAKWYNYNPSNQAPWDLNLIMDRGLYNFTQDEINRAATDPSLKTKINGTGFDLINNTYLVALNLRFRSYQAVVQEAAALAKAAGSMFGSIGSLAADVASSAASAAAGDGYTVQAVSHLYKLKWNDELNDKFAEEIYGKNASLEDLINSGLCELEYLGKEKAQANVRQSLFSSKPMSDLVKRATTRAVDAAIVKLQNKNEQFRTATPIIGGDGNGIIHAAIGTKEGLSEKDEYEILEALEDENGRISYKSIGTVKPVKGKIWNNVYGAVEEAEENAKNAQGKDKDFDNDAVNYGYTEFKGKKGDYTGYFIRLKKKK
ncbi:MAG: hypothetical protein K2N03_03445 [Muribaculaceae bacterium]|nr:hypothetical protein [Muribaculaceae bacterium]